MALTKANADKHLHVTLDFIHVSLKNIIGMA